MLKRLFGSNPAPPAEMPLEGLEELRTQVDAVTQLVRSLHAEYEKLEAWKRDILTAVDEGIRHVDRVEARVRATVRRAREELEEHGFEHPGLEAEARELRDVDGDGSEGGRVQPVPSDVGGDPVPDLSAFPGTWTRDHVRYLRGA